LRGPGNGYSRLILRGAKIGILSAKANDFAVLLGQFYKQTEEIEAKIKAEK
jgi:hypothetical protein